MIQPSRGGDAIVESPDQRSDMVWKPETAEETEEKQATLGNLEWERWLDSLGRREISLGRRRGTSG